MSLVRQQATFLVQVQDLLKKASELGFVVTGGELHRTAEQQRLYIKNGRSKTMKSQHLKRLAIDLNFFKEDAEGKLNLVYDADVLRPIGDYWEGLDPANRWGGNWNNFKDTPHFERRDDVAAKALEDATKKLGADDVFEKAGTKIINTAVGNRCPNHRDDVETVQRLLNLSYSASEINTGNPLVTDGLFGEKTLNAIRGFQQNVLGMSAPDCVISVGRSTITKLCSYIPKQIDQDLISLLYLKAHEKDVNELTEPINKTMAEVEIDSPLRKAHFLAQIGHESGELRFKKEVASGEAYNGRIDLGNTEAGDGPKFKGRGLIQLTGRSNYRAYGNTINVNLEETPDLVTEDPSLCVGVAGWYWQKHDLNRYADNDDLEGLTRRINGGLNGLADRRRLLERAKALLGV